MDDISRQSALDAALGSDASLVQTLSWALFAGGALIFILVMALAAYGVAARPRQIDSRRWIVGAGLLFPIVTLTGLLFYSIGVNGSLRLSASEEPVRIHVTAKQWWWEVRYERPGGEFVALANEIHIPVDRNIELILTTADVIHSFWAPALAGKVDMVPGRSNRLTLRTSQAGVYRGQCAEYCGLQHALMAFYIVAESEAQFAAWLARQAEPIAAQPSSQTGIRSGSQLFVDGGCAACHAIRGTSAAGALGPDLTHIGSRRSLAAGILSNHVGTMAGWIVAAQDVKPGNAMPSTSVLTGEELRALAAWLGSLQ